MHDSWKQADDNKNGVLLVDQTGEPEDVIIELNENRSSMFLNVVKQDETLPDAHSSGCKHPCTYWESLFHLIKGNSGSGMFAMGDAFKHAGLLLGPVLTLVLGVICVYGNHILVNCSKELGRRKKLKANPTFPDTMGWAFEDGPRGFQRWASTIRFLVKLFNVMAQLSFCSVYFIFISSTLENILKKYGYDVNVHVLIAVIFVPMVSTAMVRRLKYLVPFSVLATVLIMTAVVLTMYASMKDLPPINSRPAVASLSRLPLFFGTVIYCFEGIGLVLPLQSDMKKPEQFGSPLGVLNVGMSIVGCLLVLQGFVGYLKYGDTVKGSLTLNLTDSLLSDIVQIAVSVGVLFSYALQFHVAVAFVWPDFSRKYGPFNSPRLAEMGLRFGLALITFTAAEVVPQLGLFISLMGSVSSTALALVFPPLCDLALNWDKHPGPNYVFDTFSLLLAVVGFSTGSYYSIVDILKAFIYTTT